MLYLALAKKSVAVYRAYNAVQEAVKRSPSEPVPLHVRNAPTVLMQGLGYGEGYIYPPASGYCAKVQSYLPERMSGSVFYQPEASDARPP